MLAQGGRSIKIEDLLEIDELEELDLSDKCVNLELVRTDCSCIVTIITMKHVEQSETIHNYPQSICSSRTQCV